MIDVVVEYFDPPARSSGPGVNGTGEHVYGWSGWISWDVRRQIDELLRSGEAQRWRERSEEGRKRKK